jgi:hypothetical protein
MANMSLNVPHKPARVPHNVSRVTLDAQYHPYFAHVPQQVPFRCEPRRKSQHGSTVSGRRPHTISCLTSFSLTRHRQI